MLPSSPQIAVPAKAREGEGRSAENRNDPLAALRQFAEWGVEDGMWASADGTAGKMA